MLTCYYFNYYLIMIYYANLIENISKTKYYIVLLYTSLYFSYNYYNIFLYNNFDLLITV